MSLWSDVKSLFRDHGERVWVRFYDRRNTEENRVLTLKDVDECSASIVEVLKGLSPGALAFMFNEENHEILGAFPAIIAALRLCVPFYAIRKPDKIEQELAKLGSRFLLSSVKISENSRLVARLSMDIFLTIFDDIENIHRSPDIVYIIQTSGTTGDPKPVFVSHASVLPNILDFKAEFNLLGSDLVLLSSPLTFDPSMVDVFVTLVSGAALLVLPSTEKKMRRQLFQSLFVDNSVSVLQCTPSLVSNIFNQSDLKTKPGSLKIIAVGGEKCSPLVKTILRTLLNSGLKVYHLYGLTEMSVWQSMIKLEESEIEEMPIFVKNRNLLSETIVSCTKGRIQLLSDTRFCLDQHGCSLSNLESGDLGVWNSDRLVWTGRSDNILKVQGRKVCLEELEESLGRVLETEVVCQGTEEEGITATILDQEKNNTVGSILEKCRQNLDSWQIPARLHLVESFTQNSHGKVDRKCPKPKNLKTEHVADAVAFFSNLWKRALAVVDEPLPGDNFVECGGNSFVAVTVANTVADAVHNLDPGFLEALISKDYETVCRLISDPETLPPSVKRPKVEYEQRHISDDLETLGLRRLSHSYRLKGRENMPRKFNASTSLPLSLKPLWKVDFEKCIDSSPLLVARNGLKLVVVGSHSGLVKCLRTQTGDQQWSVRLPDRVEGSPATDFESIYVGCYDFNLYSIGLEDARINWIFKTQGIVKCTPLVVEDSLFFGSYDKFFYKLDKEGTCQWKIKISEGSIYSSPILVPGGVVAATLDGILALLHPDTGDTLWKTRIGHPIFASPLWHPDSRQIFVACVDHKIYSISLDGEVFWNIKTEAPIFSSPVLYNNNMLFGCHDGFVYCIDPGGTQLQPKKSPILDKPAAGSLVWRTNVSDPVFGSPDYGSCGRIVCSTILGNIFVLDSEGNILHKLTVPGHVFSSPIFMDTSIIVGCRDNFLYSFSIIDESI